MEIALLAFALGATIAMSIAAFSGRLTNLFAILLIPFTVTCLWYFWATHGVQFFLNKVQAPQSSIVIDRKPTDVAGGAKQEISREDYLAALGQTGDLFGGINALFAALAFAGVAIAAAMQAKSLKLAHEQHLQQSFEPLFFRLLELHASVAAPKFKLRSRIDRRSKGVVSSDGIESPVDFSRAMAIFRRALRIASVRYKFSPNRGDRLAEDCLRIYDIFYEQNENELGPHFRSLYHIFKLIDDSELGGVKKIRYANIARSTLSRDQLFLLAVNCLSPMGRQFRPYVEKYGLLKHIAREPGGATIDSCIGAWCYRGTAMLGARARAGFGDVSSGGLS